MSSPVIDIFLKAHNASAVKSDIRGVADETLDLGKATDKVAEATGRFVDKAGRLREANGQYVTLKSKVDDVDKSLTNIGNNDGLTRQENNARSFYTALDQARSQTENLNRSMEATRNTGMAMTAVGAGGLMLSHKLAEVAEEGNAVEARLESILKQQGRLNDMPAIKANIQDVAVKGHFADDDELIDADVKLASFNAQTKHMGELLEMSARQARTMGTEVSGVAEQLGKAYNTGQVSSLKKSGVTIDQSDIDTLKEAYKISKELGQQKFMEIIGPAIINNTVDLKDSLTAAQAAANDAARATDEAMTAIGTGSKNAEASIASVGGRLMQLVAASPEVAEQAGAFLTYGSAALTAGGGLVTLAGSAGQAYLGLIALKNARAAEAAATATQAQASTAAAGAQAGLTTAQATGAGAANANAGAQGRLAITETAGAGAATTDATAHGALTLAEMEAATAAAVAQTQIQLLAAAELRAAATAGTMATATVTAGSLMAMAFSGPGLAIAAIGTAAALTVGAVAHSVSQHIGWIDKEQSYLDRLTSGWERLKGVISGTNVEWERNEEDLQTEIDNHKAANSEKVLKGTMTQKAADEDNRTFEIAVREAFAKEQMRIGDKANMTKNQEAAARLKEQDEMQASMKSIATSPATALGAALADDDPDAGDDEDTPTRAKAGTPKKKQRSTPVAVPEIDLPGMEFDIDAIEALEDTIAEATDKATVKQARAQLRMMKRGAKHKKDRERLEKAEQRAKEKEAKALSRREEKARKLRLDQRNALADQMADIALAEMDAETDLAIKELEAQKVDGADNSRIMFQIGQIKSTAIMERARRAAAGLKEEDDLGREKLLKIARINANKILRETDLEIAKAKDTGFGALERMLANGGSLSDLRDKAGKAMLPTLSTPGATSGPGSSSGPLNPLAGKVYENTSGAFVRNGGAVTLGHTLNDAILEAQRILAANTGPVAPEYSGTTGRFASLGENTMPPVNVGPGQPRKYTAQPIYSLDSNGNTLIDFETIVVANHSRRSTRGLPGR